MPPLSATAKQSADKPIAIRRIEIKLPLSIINKMYVVSGSGTIMLGK
jgi:hypothetical protein